MPCNFIARYNPCLHGMTLGEKLARNSFSGGILWGIGLISPHCTFTAQGAYAWLIDKKQNPDTTMITKIRYDIFMMFLFTT
ncbi:MAG TPA: hypothetical protein VFV16_04440 [Candidatus Nitrosotalea sp.]|nr:hypothetical protein [Candidatus Nitrosotalea sp.]